MGSFPANNFIQLSMANILITGGSSGIGFDVIKTLSDNGDNVLVLTRSPETLDNLPGVSAFFYDVEDENAQLPELPDTIEGFVYTPGTVNIRPFQRIKHEEFLRDLQINFLGSVNILQSIYKKLRKAGNASVVFYSSVAVQTGMPYHSAVSASKGAVEGLVRALAAEFAPHVRVNGIAPSMTDTKLASRFLNSDENRKKYDQNHPLKRVGKPADIKNVTLFLLSEQSSWMTGQILHVDGGMSSVKFL